MAGKAGLMWKRVTPKEWHNDETGEVFRPGYYATQARGGWVVAGTEGLPKLCADKAAAEREAVALSLEDARAAGIE